MSAREQILAEIATLPDEKLGEIYVLVRGLSASPPAKPWMAVFEGIQRDAAFHEATKLMDAAIETEFEQIDIGSYYDPRHHDEQVNCVNSVLRVGW